MKKIAGQKILAVRLMNAEESKYEGWEDHPAEKNTIVLILQNGLKLYAARDPEGNGPGELFGRDGLMGFTISKKEFGHDPKKS